MHGHSKAVNLAAIFGLIGILGGPAAMAAKTDVVELVNGDRITGEVKQLYRGKLEFKTDNLGTVYIEWDKIARLQSKQILHVELESGDRLVGPIEPGDQDGALRVGDRSEYQQITVAQTLRMAPLDTAGSIRNRFDGHIDIGFSSTKASDVTELSLDTGISHLNEKRLWDFDFSAIQSDSESSEYTNVSAAGLTRRFFADRWYWTGVLQFEHNDAQDLDLRTLLGGGLGRMVLQSNKHQLALGAGVAISRERIDGADDTNSTELMLAFSYDAFRFDDPELDLTAQVVVFPSLTESGRVRAQSQVSLRYEIVNNLYAKLSLNNDYDSDPRTVDATKNDYSITTSIGYTF